MDWGKWHTTMNIINISTEALNHAKNHEKIGLILDKLDEIQDIIVFDENLKEENEILTKMWDSLCGKMDDEHIKFKIKCG